MLIGFCIFFETGPKLRSPHKYYACWALFWCNPALCEACLNEWSPSKVPGGDTFFGYRGFHKSLPCIFLGSGMCVSANRPDIAITVRTSKCCATLQSSRYNELLYICNQIVKYCECGHGFDVVRRNMPLYTANILLSPITN